MIDINSLIEGANLELTEEQKTALSAKLQEQTQGLMSKEVALNHPDVLKALEGKFKGSARGEILSIIDKQIGRSLNEVGINGEPLSEITSTTDTIEKIKLMVTAIKSANGGKTNEDTKGLEEKIRELQANSAKAIEEVNKDWESKWTAKENEITTAKINNSITSEVSTFNLLGDMDAQTLRPVINAKLAQLGYALVMGQNGVEVRSAANPEQLAIKDNKLVVFKELIAEITNPFVKKSNDTPLPNGNPIVVTPNTGAPNKLLEHYKKVLG